MNTYETLWGMDAKHKQPLDHIDERADNVHKIIEQYKRYEHNRRCKCESWINSLASKFERNGYLPALKNTLVARPVIGWIGKVFDLIENYSEQFNNRLSFGGTLIAVQRPSFHHVGCREGRRDWMNEEERLIYEGHVSMPQKSLVIRGKEYEVDMFLVPSNLLLGFSSNSYGEDDFPTLVRVTFSEFASGQAVIHYHENGENIKRVLTEESLPELAQFLLSHLIQANFHVA